MCFFFFFSSRRRHTRLQGDWSSDVCSSDLFQLQDIVILYHTLEPVLSEQAKAVGGPLVERIKTRFAQGMSDEEEMNALNAQAFECELIYAYEDAIREDFAKEGRDIDRKSVV